MTERPLGELLATDEPAWPLVQSWIREAARPVEVRPVSREDGEDALRRLQVTARSPLGAVALETGGLLVDDGWIRILGGGSDGFPSIVDWNGFGGEPLVDPVAGGFVVAYDAIGGFFLAREETRTVWSFMPDSVEWQDTELGYGDFVHWTLNGDLELFYEGLRWEGWRDEVRRLPPDRGLLLWPPPATREGKDVAAVSRREVPVAELWGLYPRGGLLGGDG